MKNAFCTFIYGNYYRFIPFYLLGIEKYYPSTDVIIIYDSLLPNKYIKFLEKYPKVILIQNAAQNIDWLKDLGHRGAAKQSVRHVLTPDVFFKFDNIYFGDVDIIHLKERISLFDFHLKQTEKLDLPFSNKVRSLPDNPTESAGRLTGLHFIKVKEYYKKMLPILDKFMRDNNFRAKLLEGTERNEHVLFNLCKKAFEFDENTLIKNKRPWHGFHLGLVRGKNYLNLKTVEENSSISLTDLKQQLSELNDKDTVNKMLVDYDCKEVYYTYKFFNISLSFRVIMKYEYLSLKDTIITKLKKIKNG